MAMGCLGERVSVAISTSSQTAVFSVKTSAGISEPQVPSPKRTLKIPS